MLEDKKKTLSMHGGSDNDMPGKLLNQPCLSLPS